MDTGGKSSWGSAIGLMPGAMFICQTLHPPQSFVLRCGELTKSRTRGDKVRGVGRPIKYIPESGLGTDYAMKPLTAHKILIASAVVFSSSFRFGNSETAQRRQWQGCVA